MKRLILLAALAAGTAIAQNADISGAQLISGDADAQLQQLARQAVTSNRKLIISAPEYWHEMILEQVRRGGGDRLQIEVRDSFAEAVMVRSDVLGGTETPVVAAPPPAAAPSEPVAAAVPAPAPAGTPIARPTPPTPAPAAPVVMRAPVTTAPVSRQAPAPAPAPVSAANRAQPAVATPAPARTTPQPAPTPTPRPLAATAAPSPASTPDAATAPAAAQAQGVTTGSAQAQITAIKRRLEANLTDGQSITRTLVQTELEPKDLLFSRDGVVAVVRRSSVRRDWFWLEGDIDLRRVELRELGPNRYEVIDRVRAIDNPRLRPVQSRERAMFAGNEPEKHASERQQLERRYNGDNRITATLLPSELNQRDVIYVGDELSVVVRVNRLLLERYWLVGRIDLGRSELLKDGNNKYRVLENIRQ